MIKVSKYYKKHLTFLILGPLFKIVEAVFDLLIPLIMKDILDHVNSSASLDNSSVTRYILFGGLVILGLGILGFMSTMVCQYMAAKVSTNISKDVRKDLYDKILRLSNKELEFTDSAFLTNVINIDVVSFQTGVNYFVRLAFRAPLLVLGALVISFIYDYQIALIFFALIPLVIIIVFVVMKKSAKKYQDIQASIDNIASFTSDSLTGSRVIRSLNKQDFEENNFEKANTKYFNNGKTLSFLNALINPLTFALINLTIILVIYLGGFKIDQNIEVLGKTMEATTLIALINYLDQIFQALIVCTNLVNIFTKSHTSIKRIEKVLNIDESIYSVKEAVTSFTEYDENNTLNKHDKVLFSFDNVSLSYLENSNYVLKDLSFTINEGDKIGIIGGTGSGKSSISNLLLRFNNATKGKILYKGVDINDIDINTLRDEVGIVFQKAVLFNKSVLNNLLMANQNASKEDVTKALETSLASEFINGYEECETKMISENGKNLSGGQKQRLSLARTLLKPKLNVLILDDFTSALDYQTDLKVRRNLKNNYSNLTTIYISQRISTIKDCDKILVINDGRIVGSGKHDDLLTSCPIYKETYLSQLKGGSNS